jgi:hypothetical protein
VRLQLPGEDCLNRLSRTHRACIDTRRTSRPGANPRRFELAGLLLDPRLLLAPVREDHGDGLLGCRRLGRTGARRRHLAGGGLAGGVLRSGLVRRLPSALGRARDQAEKRQGAPHESMDHRSRQCVSPL